MRLTDTVQIITAGTMTDRYGNTVPDWDHPAAVVTMPAVVTYSTVSVNAEPGRTAFVEELRAITEPFSYNPETQRIRWRGLDYTADGPAMIRRRDGRDHHQTMPLVRVTG